MKGVHAGSVATVLTIFELPGNIFTAQHQKQFRLRRISCRHDERAMCIGGNIRVLSCVMCVGREAETDPWDESIFLVSKRNMASLTYIRFMKSGRT